MTKGFFERGNSAVEHLRHVKGRCRDADDGWLSQMAFLADMIPHYWREEAKNQPEWWIRYGRSIGLHGIHDPLADSIRWRLTRDADDEATITWPGKPQEPLMQTIYEDGQWYLLPAGAVVPVIPGGGRLILGEVTAKQAESLKVYPGTV